MTDSIAPRFVNRADRKTDASGGNLLAAVKNIGPKHIACIPSDLRSPSNPMNTHRGVTATNGK